MTEETFSDFIMEIGGELYRDMPWRSDTQPYFVLVSEIMLQQTQVSRVIPKFSAFIDLFPDLDALANAQLAEVIGAWQGLGYNRRAKYLHDSARQIIASGRFPQEIECLQQLPGIGENTAGAIVAYAFNKPSIFIETNIRTVYMHHFFSENESVSDTEIIDILQRTIDHSQPRRFYQSVMDYGDWLKRSGIKNTSKSKHYIKQTPLAGSLREMRGYIIGLLTSEQTVKLEKLYELTSNDARVKPALAGLKEDGLITVTSTEVKLGTKL